MSDNSGLILRDFCAWQADVNQPRDPAPEHFDTAVLLTREVEGLQTLQGKGAASTGERVKEECGSNVEPAQNVGTGSPLA